MKKIILIILILILFVGGAIILNNYINKSNNDIEDISKANNITNDEKIKNKNEINNESEADTIENNFKVIKIEENDFNKNYTIQKPIEIITKNYLKIEEENNNLLITLIESNQNRELLQDKNSVTYNKRYTISNISTKDIDEIFYGVEGQDIMYPLVYILQKDGTIKGIDTEYGYKTGNFIAENVLGLENVEKIEQASVTPPNDSGYEAIIAITKDKSVYEIRK